jgi:hypothetical protein
LFLGRPPSRVGNMQNCAEFFGARPQSLARDIYAGRCGAWPRFFTAEVPAEVLEGHLPPPREEGRIRGQDRVPSLLRFLKAIIPREGAGGYRTGMGSCRAGHDHFPLGPMAGFCMAGHKYMEGPTGILEVSLV